MRSSHQHQLPPAIRHLLETIRSDNTSGAAELVLKAAGVLEQTVEMFSYENESDYRKTVQIICIELVKAQPVMAPIVNLANSALFTIENLHTNEEIKKSVLEVSHQITAQAQASPKAIAQNAMEFIHNDATILTYSRSSTVLITLIKAKSAGKRFEVICPESRPICEGVMLAKELGEAGIPVRLVTDAAAFSRLSTVQTVFVGADAISLGGVANKIGTRSLALSARAIGIPCYVLCGVEKFLPAGYSLLRQPVHNPNEVCSETYSNVTVLNQYFDVTPLEYITGCITNERAKNFAELHPELERLALHQALQNV